MTLNEMNGQDPVDHICSKRKKEKKRKRIIHQINKNLTPSLSPSLAVVGSISADEKAFLPLSSLERDKDSRVWCYRIKELHHLICESRIFSAWFILSSEMERDFMGLSSKEPLAVVKEEIIEGAFTKGSGIQWPFSNKISALPHFMSFKTAQEDKSKKVASDSLVTSGFDPSNKCPAGEMQKAVNPDRQGGSFAVTAYPVQHDSHLMNHHPHDVKMFPVSNQTISVSMGNPFFKTHFAAAGQNMVGAALKQQLLGGIPVSAPHGILPSAGSFAGITEPWNNFKTSGSPSQLTIFYAGTVNVYDDISPEKAQAIMFLAGNGASMASRMGQPRAQVQTPASKLAAGDGVLANQPMNISPCSGLSSPISVSSHPVAQSGSGSTSTEEVLAAKTTGVSATPVTKLDSPKMLSVAATPMMPSAVPQARKASLARFLEKRKERVMSTAPYNISKKSPECATPGSNGMSYTASSGAGASAGAGALSANKE
ncbi:protein TIFY 6B isoform X2 [Vitis vinifera]|nr:protein TIFY 6B isoform X2 [Vitis vinifera]